MTKKEQSIKLLKDWWKSDMNIEIEVKRPRGVVIFATKGYWNDGNWYFEGKYFTLPDEEYMSKKFKEEFIKYDGEDFTLEEAIEFIENLNIK